VTMPALFFGLVAAILYGSLFHLVRGGGLGRLVLYLALSGIGFAGGQLVATWRGWRLFLIGPLDIGAATIGSVLVLAVGYWFSLVRVSSGGDHPAV